MYMCAIYNAGWKEIAACYCTHVKLGQLHQQSHAITGRVRGVGVLLYGVVDIGSLHWGFQAGASYTKTYRWFL